MTPEELARWIAAVPGPITPRIAGMAYDWDRWPLRVAAGESETSWHLARMQREVNAIAAGIGLALYPTVRAIAALRP